MGGVRLRVVGTRVFCFAKALKRTEQRDRVIVFDFWNPHSLEECEDSVEMAGKMMGKQGVDAIASSMKMALIGLVFLLIFLVLL